jgi:predicted O-methyltransferase YrrM
MISGSYANLEPVWKSIPGFFDFQDLYGDIADWSKGGEVLVEVGSFLGRSACWLGERLQSLGKKSTLICVDEWPVFYEWASCSANRVEGAFEIFVANVRQSGLQDMIVPIRGKSLWAASFIRNDLDFVFIDANHEYESVKADIAAWLPKVKRGGMLAGHDYDDNFPGVKQAVNEAFPGRFTVRGRCWVVAIV